ncbi:MAG: cyclic nucleotide-binding domain-containing protein, partial [Chloroflexi bacterium]|nr:cyclic nucleotide-binding domain-containing protein [Chloroflexota bacterium]
MAGASDPAKVALLGHIDLFDGCTHADLRRIAELCEEHEVEQGTLLTKEGEERNDVFVVIEGVARVERGGHVVSRIGEGGFFGELAVLDPGPRTATVVAESPMFVLVLRAEHLEEVVRQNPAVAMTM